MSLIVHKDRVLYADQSGISTYGGNESFQIVKKLHVSAGKLFALAITGDEMDFDSASFRRLEKVIVNLIKQAELDVTGEYSFFEKVNLKDVSGIAFDFYNKLKSQDFSIIVMSRIGLYVLDFSKEEEVIQVELCKLPPNLFAVNGSGRVIFECLLATGMSVEEAFQKTPSYEFSMFPTPTVSVKASSLTPLVPASSKRSRKA